MKNLFKSLMLVAVAAMAFTACEKDNNETNKTEQKTVITGVATIENDDTRSGFLPKEDGATSYKSAWEGDETLKAYFGDTTYEGTITDKDGHFTIEVNGELPSSIELCSPRSAFTGSVYYPVVPAEQTPLANSVDPAAHILRSQSTPITNGSVAVTMQHAVAYGKMTVNTPAEFVIDYVTIVLQGTMYGWEVDDYSYTINADNVENNTFWFASDVMDVSGFTVTAYDAENNAYTKTVEVPADKLKFQIGRVSTFSVSDLTEVVVPAFTSAEVITDWGEFDQVIKFYSDEIGNLEVEFYNPDNEILTSERVLKEDVYSLINGDKNKLWYATYGNGDSVINVTITVSHVNGAYHIDFTNVGGYNNVTFIKHATFTGNITGLGTPDSRARLATPNVTAEASTTAPEITFSWNAVDNAVSYNVTFDGETYSTTDLTKTFSDLSWNTSYNISVVAVAEANSETYRDSEAGTASATTIKNPDAVANGSKENPYTFTVSNKTNVAIEFTCAENGASLHLELNGPIKDSANGTEYTLNYQGPWYSRDHWYKVDDVTYSHASFASYSTSIITKLPSGESQILFKMVVSEVPVYYVAVVPSNY